MPGASRRGSSCSGLSRNKSFAAECSGCARYAHQRCTSARGERAQISPAQPTRLYYSICTFVFRAHFSPIAALSFNRCQRIISPRFDGAKHVIAPRRVYLSRQLYHYLKSPKQRQISVTSGQIPRFDALLYVALLYAGAIVRRWGAGRRRRLAHVPCRGRSPGPIQAVRGVFVAHLRVKCAPSEG